jgi:hypothetical protein
MNGDSCSNGTTRIVMDLAVRRHGKSSTLSDSLGIFILVLLALIWTYCLAQAFGSASFTRTLNLLGPLVLGITAGVVGWHTVRKDASFIWTPFVWLMAGIVLFYSLGPLIYPLGGSRITGIVNSFIPVDARQLLATNLLNGVGILSMLVGFWLVEWWARHHRSGQNRQSMRYVEARTVALLFLIVGGTLELFLILPYSFGLLHFVLPGVIVSLGYLFTLGLLVAAYLVACGKKSWYIPFFFLWTFQILVSILTFSKGTFLLTLALPVVGAYWGNRKMAWVVIGVLVLTIIYFSLQGFIDYGRQQLVLYTGNSGQGSVMQRLEITRDWLSGRNLGENSGPSSFAGGWARLDYAPVQAFAMERYNEGYPGHTLKYAMIIFIPRFLWSRKPIITNMAVHFYALVTGHHGTHLGLGIFGEGYWDGGWLGVIGLSCLAGVVMAVMTLFVLRWMREDAFEYLPSVFLGITMAGFSTTELFVPAIMGGAGFFAAYAIIVWLIKEVAAVRWRRKKIPASLAGLY